MMKTNNAISFHIFYCIFSLQAKSRYYFQHYLNVLFDIQAYYQNQNQYYQIAFLFAQTIKLMRIKKYQHWKLTNNNNQSHRLNSSPHSASFSISQLLSTTNHLHQTHQPHLLPQTISSFAYLTKRIPNKTQITCNHYNNNLQIKAQQKTQREQLIKTKIKQRLKQQYNTQSFNIKTNRTFFATNSINKSHDVLATTVDKLEKYEQYQNDGSVHVKGKSLPFTTLPRTKSKSTVMGIVGNNSVKKYIVQKPQKQKLNLHNNSTKKTIFWSDLKRQHSLNLQVKKDVPSHGAKTTFVKNIQPWDIEHGPDEFWT